jgi:type VI secretion system protein VasI
LVRVIVLVLSFLALALPAHAQDTGETCAAIAADAERLACYDAIFRAPIDGPVIETPAASEVLITSEQLIPARPVGRAPAEMVIACVEGQIGVRFAFANQLLSSTSDNVGVTLQVDLGGNIVRNLPVDDENLSASFATAADANVFLETLEGARSLRVRITPVRQRSLTVDFRLADFRDEIGAVRAACS